MNRPLFLSLLAASLAGSVCPRDADARTKPPLRIGTMPADFGSEAYFAKDLGMFAKGGFPDVAITSLHSGAAIAAATLSGSLDVGYSNVLTLAIAHSKDIPVMLLAGANIYDESAPTVGLLGIKRSSPIKSASDLTGKTLAVNALNNIPYIGMRNWIDTNGGDSSKVHFIEMPNTAMGAAIIAGRVDGGSMNQGDYPTLGKPDDPIRVLANTFASIAPKFISGAWFSTSTWIDQNERDAKAFTAVINDAGTWANSHHQKSATILSRYLNESAAAIEATPRVAFATSLNAQLLQPSIDVAAKYGLIKSAFPANAMIAGVAG